MNDLKSLIRDMANDGTSVEDIAKQLSKALNEVQREKNTSKNEREAYLDELEIKFHKAYANECINMDDLAGLCVMVCSGSYPEWTRSDMEDFFVAVQDNIRSTAAIIGKSPLEALGTLFESIKSKEVQPPIMRVKPKSCEIEPKPTGSSSTSSSSTCKGKCGADRKKKSTVDEDLAKLGEFLESLTK